MELNLGLVKGAEGVSFLSPTTVAGGRTICNFCTMQANCDYEATDSCHLYVPPLNFRGPSGLEKYFSTVRMGGAWSRRVKIGSVVGLVSTNPIVRIGLARVTKIETGSLLEACAMSAPTHHHFLDGKFPAEEIPERLRKLIRNVYGSFVNKEGQEFSVIHCRRMSIVECQRVKTARSVA